MVPFNTAFCSYSAKVGSWNNGKDELHSKNGFCFCRFPFPNMLRTVLNHSSIFYVKLGNMGFVILSLKATYVNIPRIW